MRLAAVVAIAAALSAHADDTAKFTRSGELIAPANYREWVFLSSGLGMTYGPNAPAADAPRRFDNVFVNPSSYRVFLRTGKWIDGTIFILEVRDSASKGSINQHGQFQTSVVAVEAHVRDARRFAQSGGSGFFDLGRTPSERPTAKVMPPGNGCQQCHSANGAVESTFVQFYPDLIPVATKAGTLRAGSAP